MVDMCNEMSAMTCIVIAMTLQGRSKYALVIQFDLFESFRRADQMRGRHIIENKQDTHTHTYHSHIYLDNRD